MTNFSDSDRLRVLRICLIAVLLIILLLHILSVLVSRENAPAWASWLDLDTERNIPTIYNGLLWLSTSVVTLILALRRQKQASKLRWIFLSLVFGYFAIDEVLILHERIARPVRELLSIGDGSVFYHAWILPALIAVGFTLLLAWQIKDRDAISQEQKTIFTWLIFLALGVIALEAIGTQIYFDRTAYKLGPVLVEEMFEMGMISILLYKGFSYIKRKT